ncbi:YceI-like domain-containing protein [Tenacibaculum adriaticum]|uniref:YceI-like domain-containing protein n=1 Tax=Tenacibaculum adriaticum TaxID=413713 RepID=A0A5S5DTR7_9FLAO|nr:YceI family protein [Tenacibaculum adriaticum]TYP99291.1 YceI-like domain-containing protein [Tenacibaculum adriaticum]
MKNLFTILICFLITNNFNAQERYITKHGTISFFSHSPVEDIEAINSQVLSIIDKENGNIAISILMKSFMFEKSLMQEHFNENYIESDKFPKATFTGKILNINNLENKNSVLIEGDMTIHGISNKIEIEADIEINKNDISLKGKFPIVVSDYDIKIPSVVKNNIAKTIEVSFLLNHKKYN